MFFLRFGVFPGVIFEVPGTPQIVKIRVRLRKAPGVHFEPNLIYFWGSFEGVSESFFEGVRGETSSVRISIGPFAPPNNVVDEPDRYENKHVSTAVRKYQKPYFLRNVVETNR